MSATEIDTEKAKPKPPRSSNEKLPKGQGNDIITSSNTPRSISINETGQVQELDRNFNLLSVCSVGIVTGNTWAALGGSIAVAI